MSDRHIWAMAAFLFWLMVWGVFDRLRGHSVQWGVNMFSAAIGAIVFLW